MNASDPANSNKLTDEQLDALLDGAGQELLLHIQASTDPTATLAKLLAAPANPNGGQADPVPADPANSPGHLADGQSTRPHRQPWRTIKVAAAAAAAAAAAVVTMSFVAAGNFGSLSMITAHTIHHPTNPVSLPSPPAQASGIFLPAPGVLSGNVTVDLPFSPGQSRLDGSAVGQLNMMLAVRSGASSIAAIIITGYAGDPRRRARADKLSAMRVQAVRYWFIAHHVPACALHTVHYGASLARDRANARIRRNVVVISVQVTANSPYTAQSGPPYYSCEQAFRNSRELQDALAHLAWS